MKSIFHMIFEQKRFTTFDSIVLTLAATLFYAGDIALAITFLLVGTLTSVIIELG